MPAATTIIAAIGAAAALGGTAYSINSSEKAREQTETDKGELARQAAKREKELKDRQAAEAQGKADMITRDAAAMKTRAARASTLGRAGTVNTGPGGVAGGGPAQYKSLLGS